MSPLRAVVLVEGNSDRVALHTAARGRGRDLAGEGVEIVAMGGITNTRAFASHYGPRGLGLPLAGLYDAPEEEQLRREEEKLREIEIKVQREIEQKRQELLARESQLKELESRMTREPSSMLDDDHETQAGA